MMKKILLAAVALALVPCGAFWPFSSGGGKQKPPRLHVLLAKANDLIEQAEDKTMEGDADAALDLYRQALAELTRVAEENPDRANTQEFAPLRHKAEACAAAIDNIRFDQVNRNSRPVVLTDTTELQKKYEEKRSLADLRKKGGAASAAQGQGQRSVIQQDSQNPEKNQQNQKQSRPPDSVKPVKSALKQAKAALRAGNHAEAIKLAEAAYAADPGSLNALMVKASAEWGTGDLYAAKDTLVAARKAFPESPVPLLNLARLALAGENPEAARKFYRKARELGAEPDAALEKALR